MANKTQKHKGRPLRLAPKSHGIWCGQITAEQRDYIVSRLSPAERYAALISAAARKSRRITSEQVLGH